MRFVIWKSPNCQQLKSFFSLTQELSKIQKNLTSLEALTRFSFTLSEQLLLKICPCFSSMLWSRKLQVVHQMLAMIWKNVSINSVDLNVFRVFVLLIRMLLPTQQFLQRYILKSLKQWCICNQTACTETNSKGKNKNKFIKPPSKFVYVLLVSVHPRNPHAHVQTQVTLQTVTDGETIIITPMKAHTENYTSKLL